MPNDSQKFEMKITATGAVRDADGNLVSEVPIEATLILTEDEVRAITERDQT